MGRLDKVGIRVALLYGNHDADSVLTRKLPLPGNVRAFGHRKAETIAYDDLGVVLHGRSFRERNTTEDLVPSYPAAVPGCFNIGVLHTALAGRAGHESYAPCTPEELSAKGYQYWALGHVHAHEIVSTSPFIVFSGNLQGRSSRETGAKGAVLVTIAERSVAQIEHLPLDAVRWCAVEISADGAMERDDLHRRLQDALRHCVEEQSAGRPLMIRITIIGETRLHGGLLEAETAIRADVQGIAVALSDRIWIEKVRVRTRAAAAPTGDAPPIVADIGAMLAAGVEDASLAAATRQEFADFLVRLPADLGDADSLLTALRGDDIGRLLRQAATALEARLNGAVE
jgi:DNA repair exonuclease SbcCD nuclease subunit